MYRSDTSWLIYFRGRAVMSETENILTDEERKFLTERKEKKMREENLNTLLSSENGSDYKILYEDGGLKEMLAENPELQDSPALLAQAVKLSSKAYKARLEQETKPPSSQTAQAQTQTPPQVPKTETGSEPPLNDTFDPRYTTVEEMVKNGVPIDRAVMLKAAFG